MPHRACSRIIALLLVCLLSLPVWAADEPVPQTPQVPGARDVVPVTRVILYKHGVGYFERQGKLDGSGDVTLEFKASEMSDVLKSMTLLTPGGTVESVSYEASDPLEKQLREFSFSLPAGASLGQVLDQFKGARLTLKPISGAELVGVILGVHRADVEKNEVESISLLLDGGEMRSFPLRDVASMKLADARLQRQLESYLQLLSTSHRRDLRLLKIHPGGARQLQIGYLVQSPVWKTSYRLVLDSEKPREALLQGWAIVDNTSAEDWKGVKLALVSGLPVSFTQNLYQAHYVNRPNVPLPSEMAAAPVAHEGGVVGGIAGGVPGGVMSQMGAAGGGGGARRDMAAMSMAAPAAPAAAPRAKAMNESRAAMMDRLEMSADNIRASVEASTQQLGELFEYRIERPVDIPHNQSAMIPFVQAPVKVERVLFYSPGTAGDHPYDAVLLENSSGKTLDGGSITVLSGGEYAGEALVETMKPGDSRPVTFAVDLGTRITTALDSNEVFVSHVRVRRGAVFTQNKNVATTSYTVRNTGAQARKLVIERPVREGWKVVSEPKPVETTAQHHRFQLDAPAKQTAKFVVKEEYESSNSFMLTNLTPDVLIEYVRNKALSPAAEKQLQAMFALKEQIAEVQREMQTRQEEINELFRDQQRLRENIANLRGVPGQQDQVNAYAAKLTSQEKDVEAKNAALTAARARQRQLQQQLDRMIATLAID